MRQTHKNKNMKMAMRLLVDHINETGNDINVYNYVDCDGLRQPLQNILLCYLYNL